MTRDTSVVSRNLRSFGVAGVTAYVLALFIVSPVFLREWKRDLTHSELGWPTAALLLVVALYPLLLLLVGVLVIKVWFSNKITLRSGDTEAELAFEPAKLPLPRADERVTAHHLALKADTWRKENNPRFMAWDKKYGYRVHRFDATIVAASEVLDRIESVTYFLGEEWQRHGVSASREIFDRASRFKLSDLAWGDFILPAHVKLRNQVEAVKLSTLVQVTTYEMDL